MTLGTTQARNLPRMMTAPILCMAFVFQLLYAPAHLTWHDHTVAAGGSANGHSHSTGDRHGDDHHRFVAPDLAEGDSESDHEPHPASDHLEAQLDPATAPSVLHFDLACEFEEIEFPPERRLVSLAQGDPGLCPRPPPPQGEAPPRAPPIVI
jgi:hypothetical protein